MNKVITVSIAKEKLYISNNDRKILLKIGKRFQYFFSETHNVPTGFISDKFMFGKFLK